MWTRPLPIHVEKIMSALFSCLPIKPIFDTKGQKFSSIKSRELALNPIEVASRFFNLLREDIAASASFLFTKRTVVCFFSLPIPWVASISRGETGTLTFFKILITAGSISSSFISEGIPDIIIFERTFDIVSYQRAQPLAS